MPEKTLLIDAHIHLYPVHHLALAIKHAHRNMEKAVPDPEAVRIWLLTERSDCDAFAQILKNGSVDGYSVKPVEDGRAMYLPEANLYIVAGRQVITQEGLELCALATTAQVQDRAMTTYEGIGFLLARGALVSINWAPGKWWGHRGKVVQSLLAEAPRPGVFIGDTAMRPAFWRQPALMNDAMQRGWRIVAGSDPLPFAGEEKSFGRYGFSCQAAWNADEPVTSLHDALLDPVTVFTCWGTRRRSAEFVRRQIQIMLEKKKRMSTLNNSGSSGK